MKKIIKAYALVIDGEVDIHYDLFDTKTLAMSYRNNYNNKEGVIVPCTVTYNSKLLKKKSGK